MRVHGRSAKGQCLAVSRSAVVYWGGVGETAGVVVAVCQCPSARTGTERISLCPTTTNAIDDEGTSKSDAITGYGLAGGCRGECYRAEICPRDVRAATRQVHAAID